MDTSSLQYSLRPKDILKASSLLEIPQESLQHFNDLYLLNTIYIRGLLMRADFEKLSHGLDRLSQEDRTYRYPEVVKAIAKEYNTTPVEVSRILHGKTEEVFFCSNCGVRITRTSAQQRGGLCSTCYADTLKL